MSLAPAPSDAKLREIARSRQLARFGRIVNPELLNVVELASHSIDTGSRAIARQGSVVVEKGIDLFTIAYVEASQTDPGFSAVIRARREKDCLHFEIETPPRTKKNGRKGAFYGVGGKAYKRYEQDIAGAIASVKVALQLPLPDQPYNIAAKYFVDRYGKAADRPGLDQGLFDALQHAGVVNNDWLFRATDGTRIIADDPHPRIEVLISPLTTES